MIMEYIYLDNAATTKVDKRVLEAMLPFMNERYGNPSSIHKPGREAKVFLEEAREVVANFFGAAPSEIYFTSGGTESNNSAIKGIAFNQLGKKNNIISSKIEHSAVLDTLNYLHDKFGFEITYIPTNKHGIIDIDILEKSINKRTFLVCLMHSNNELGVINDVNTLSKIVGERDIYFHTDTVQSIGKIHFNVNELDCTTATVSPHKIYGPKGIGLYT